MKTLITLLWLLPTTAFAQTANSLFGRWQSIDDHNYIIVFQKNQTGYEYYIGDAKRKDTFVWVIMYDGEAKSNKLTKRFNSDLTTPYEYYIYKQTSKLLYMSYVARGNSLRFRKLSN